MFKYERGQRITVKETGLHNVVHQSTGHNVMCVDGSIKHVDDIKPYSNKEKWEPKALVLQMSVIHDTTTDAAMCINELLSKLIKG
jgi:hypothetical protein